MLALTPAEDESRAGLVDNLAASIYKQGEQANEQANYRAAADHFLRIKQVAPTSKIRAAAEYDAGAALMRLEDWATAADVLDAFRATYPEHELQREATKQIAFVYRKAGKLSRSAEEYERVATESDDPELRARRCCSPASSTRRRASPDRALARLPALRRAVPEAGRGRGRDAFQDRGDLPAQERHDAATTSSWSRSSGIDAAAGSERTARTRFLAAQSALVLAQQLYESFAALKLLQPFEQSLEEKQRRMNAATRGFGQLVDYQVGEITAAATFYLGEIYSDFSRALRESERPAGLAGAKLQEYEDALDEEAFPFEEKAIEVHEKNLELMSGDGSTTRGSSRASRGWPH